MSSPSLVTKELLFAYFAGQATVVQKQMLEKWVRDKKESEEFFYGCLHEWETKHPQYQADTEEALIRFNQNWQQSAFPEMQPAVEPLPTYRAAGAYLWKTWLVAASVLFLLFSVGWLFRDVVLYKNFATGPGEVQTIQLADGSQVVLNADSELRVPRFGFGHSQREVQLKGEGLFSIVRTADNRKFVVSTAPLFRVEVLGTQFNLSARAGGAKVVLQEGSVMVHFQGTAALPDTSLAMAPGDMVTVDTLKKQLVKKSVKHPDNYSAWQHRHFVFDNTSLSEIKEMLLDNYGQVVELKGTGLTGKTVSGSFRASNADELLLVVAEMLNISFQRKGAIIVLADKPARNSGL